MDMLSDTWAWLQNAMAWPIIQTTEFRISAGSLAALVVLVLLLFWTSKRLQHWLSEGPVLRKRLDPGARLAVAAVVRYTVLLVGLLAIVQTVGIDLTTFNVMAGAIGIGVGFGLQNVVSNFIAGLIIMFERPVKIGDRIVVGGVEGNVVDIGARSTTVLDNDNIAVIVPNSKFITEDVINWKYNDDSVRFHVPVSVAYGTDAQLVKRVLLEVAQIDPDVLDTPEPNVWLKEFGDNGVVFELMVWSASLVDRKGRLISQLNYAIYERFNAEGIEFPFPQRDLHIKGGVLGIRQVPAE
ncbi:mechanosensitive ion channel domain-containing protein [Hydrogenophaga sp.]|uniref:mechanosensitive ion channel family protein n=1 Tax=Hydrogenophaga sp. TaxID=1904254 RepID=UPI0025BD5E1C|nr:mechanosensitive ion channel domain-containing protein [Hydrogenophaga sp.]